MNQEFRARFEDWMTKLQAIAEQIPMAMGSQIMAVVKDMAEYYKKTEPKEPRTLDDAYRYGLRKVGTYVALIDDDEHLVRTVRVSEKQLKEAPAVAFDTKEISVKMKQYLLVIPSLNIEKPVPKTAIGYKAFTSDKEEIVLL